MVTPNRGPNRRQRYTKGTPIRVRTPNHETSHMKGGKVTHYSPKTIVWVGRERRDENDRRNPSNDRRAEWRNPDKTKRNPKLWGQRKIPSRKYDPKKYPADAKLPKEWFKAVLAEYHKQIIAIATHHKVPFNIAEEAILDRFRKTKEHIYGGHHRIGDVEYGISYDPVSNSFFWNSTRRTTERRKGDRREPTLIVEFDEKAN